MFIPFFRKKYTPPPASAAPSLPASFEDRELENLSKIAKRLDSLARVSDHILLLQSSWRIVWVNFLTGMARGVGLTIGTAIVLVIAFKIAQQLITMNIPYLTDLLVEVVQAIKKTGVTGTDAIQK